MEDGHSEDYFKEFRDFWWNHDFLELMARRLRLAECSKLLDVGCGQCHWSRLLVSFMNSPAEIHAVDADPRWSKGSDELRRFFASQGQGSAVTFKQGDAQALPYDSDSFDIVTCQTTLIHVRNPRAAVIEMHRVVKPGGLVLCAEPNNVVSSLVKSNLSAEDSIEDTIRDVKHALMLERGKMLLGEGDNSYGDLLPGVFSEVGFDDIRVYLSDKASPLYPPYETPEQQALLRTDQEWSAEDSGPCDWEKQRRYLRALGDEYLACFEELQKRSRSNLTRYCDAVKNKRYSSGGGLIMYLVSGRKVE